MPASEDLLIASPRIVKPDWIDANGHMNVGYYNIVFGKTVGEIFETLGMGGPYIKTRNHSTFAAEMHVAYFRELHEGDPIDTTFQLLDVDAKRIHFCMQLRQTRDNYVAATNETVSIHVDLSTRRAVPFPEDIQARLDDLMKAHKNLPRAAHIGRPMGLRRKKTDATQTKTG